MLFGLEGSHQKNAAPLQSFIKSVGGTGVLPNPFMSAKNANVPRAKVGETTRGGGFPLADFAASFFRSVDTHGPFAISGAVNAFYSSVSSGGI